MDLLLGGDGGAGDSIKPQKGGGTRRRKARVPDASQISGGDVAVEKIPQGGLSVSVSVKPALPAPAPATATATPATATLATATLAPVPVAPVQIGGGPQKVVIAPPKKRPPKLLLVPGVRHAPRAAALHKTFKAHKVRVVIDNTAKTQRRRRQTLQSVDAMTEEQLRGAAVAARLSRRETVAKVPIDLLRQMLKDYRMMRGMLL
jgi:hypothetical protein